jgi:hypothetical protein
MSLIKDLQADLLRATGVDRLEVSLWSRSSSNIVVLLQEPDGEAFFAKVFAYDVPGGLTANQRYKREKAILSAMDSRGAPELVFSADVERVLVTRGVVGRGVKHFIDNGNALVGLGAISQWLARFHNRFETHPAPDHNLLQHFEHYLGYTSLNGFEALGDVMQSLPLNELVMSRGDGSASNFRFTEDRVVGLDFEGAAYRAPEADMIAIAQDFHVLTGEGAEAISKCVVSHYAFDRAIKQPERTIELISGFLEILGPHQAAA